MLKMIPVILIVELKNFFTVLFSYAYIGSCYYFFFHMPI